MFTRLDYSSALEYSIIRRYTNIVLYIIINIQTTQIGYLCIYCIHRDWCMHNNTLESIGYNNNN